ncbi:hypothetical protein ALC56_06694 [Trachymyrmex septentrionalis]|uniref:Uncharacterized protein n=1 Tax=Trachymyrmex septentrionalis TaxID=34720 RepID=A0A151JWM7_9HYME|nr:hypothetical protein ALC56_06694 [Trachymyrmex septentrionalis]
MILEEVWEIEKRRFVDMDGNKLQGGSMKVERKRVSRIVRRKIFKIRTEGIPKYLKKGWEKSNWRRIIRYKLGNEMRGSLYWQEENKRICKLCGGEEETWEHIWERRRDWKRYGKTREALITRFTDSQKKQMRTLLSGIEFGDKIPSQLLREMRTLAGENAIEGLLRTFWQQGMPTRIQEMLLIFDDTNLNKLAECADKFHKHSSSVDVHAATSSDVNGSTRHRTAAGQVIALLTQVEKLTKQPRARSRSRSRTRRSGNTPAKDAN